MDRTARSRARCGCGGLTTKPSAGTCCARRPSAPRGKAPSDDTPEEFDELAAKGKEHYDRLLADKRPTTAFNDEDQWKDICSGAYKAAQESWGGQTIDPATGKAIERSKGFSLQVRAPGEKQLTVPEDASEDEFNEMMERARKEYAEKLKGKEVYLGVFRDDDNNRIDFDPVTIVDTEAEVDSLGAYTHAVGGAYDFATGNGHFPPHVASNRTCPGAQEPSVRIDISSPERERYTHACPSCGKVLSAQPGGRGTVTAHAPADDKYHQREINKLHADKDGYYHANPNAQQALLDHHVGWIPGGKTASLASDVKDAVHVWSTIKVNNQKALPNPEHDGFRYAFHQILGDVGNFRYNASDPLFLKGEHEATVFLKAFMDNQTASHKPLYRAIGLHPAAYMEILSSATAGTLDLPPASWSANKKLTEQFGLDYMQGTKKYEERIIFVTRPGTKSWALGRASNTGYEREHIVGGRFHVVSIKFPPETDNTTVITLQETEGWPEDFASTGDMIEHMAFDSAVVSPQDTGKTARYLTIDEARAGAIDHSIPMTAADQADHVDPHKGTMIAVRPPESVCQELALDRSPPVRASRAASRDAGLHRPGRGSRSRPRPPPPDCRCAVATLSVHRRIALRPWHLREPGWRCLRRPGRLRGATRCPCASCRALERAGIEVSREHGFIPHITLTYGDHGPLAPSRQGRVLLHRVHHLTRRMACGSDTS